jgi:hypothetical protein
MTGAAIKNSNNQNRTRRLSRWTIEWGKVNIIVAQNRYFNKFKVLKIAPNKPLFKGFILYSMIICYP